MRAVLFVLMTTVSGSAFSQEATDSNFLFRIDGVAVARSASDEDSGKPTSPDGNDSGPPSDENPGNPTSPDEGDTEETTRPTIRVSTAGNPAPHSDDVFEPSQEPTEDPDPDSEAFPPSDGGSPRPVERGPFLTGITAYSSEPTLLVLVESRTTTTSSRGCSGQHCPQPQEGQVINHSETRTDENWTSSSPLFFFFDYADPGSIPSGGRYTLLPVGSSPNAEGLYEYSLSHSWVFDANEYSFTYGPRRVEGHDCRVSDVRKTSAVTRLVVPTDDGGGFVEASSFHTAFPVAGESHECPS